AGDLPGAGQVEPVVGHGGRVGVRGGARAQVAGTGVVVGPVGAQVQLRCLADGIRGGVLHLGRGRQGGRGVGRGEQLADQVLGGRVAAFADRHVPHGAGGVDQVRGRPRLVVVVVPGGVVVVQGDRVRDAQPLRPGGHVAGYVLERVLGRVYADHLQPGG